MSKLLFTSVWAQRGDPVHLEPFIFEYFSVGISVRNLHHMFIHLKQPISAKRTIKNGGQKTNLCFTKIVMWPKFENPLFQRNFSIKFGSWLKNMNAFIFIKFEKYYLVSKWWPKQVLWHWAIIAHLYLLVWKWHGGY